ncbi:DUF6163 family protein [Aurantimonas sp. Leaf443]|uniref:DUF6163 family protein n=1 Tax=Aurantimonas sp. Leaf443 TaxID=1736378 RepID=UPI0006F62894|nr:DUF6163 family protein [Aurantimonas sp. Leaf443]KQT88432.1 hypothetical protein ASG48_03185 [Aurantimonas sp. Leaf443]
MKPIGAESEERLNRRLTIWLLRLFSVALFWIGIGCWIRLVGIFDGPLSRFDLMPVWWKIATPALAVLYPVAAMGLWLPATWGVVIWVLIATTEVMMHVGFPHLFGPGLVLPALHLFGLTMLLILRLIGWREKRRARGY